MRHLRTTISCWARAAGNVREGEISTFKTDRWLLVPSAGSHPSRVQQISAHRRESPLIKGARPLTAWVMMPRVRLSRRPATMRRGRARERELLPVTRPVRKSGPSDDCELTAGRLDVTSVVFLARADPANYRAGPPAMTAAGNSDAILDVS